MKKLLTRYIDANVKESAIFNNCSEFQANIIAGRNWGRNKDITKWVSPKAKELSTVDNISGIGKASSRITRAVNMGEMIGISCDYTPDSIFTASVYYQFLVYSLNHPRNRVRIFCSDLKSTDFSEHTADDITSINPRCSLIITSGQGSNSHSAIDFINKFNKKHSIITDIIITDTQKVIESDKKTKIFCHINPSKPASNFNTKNINSAIIALMVCIATKDKFSKKNGIHKDTINGIDKCALLTSLGCLCSGEKLDNEVTRSVIKTTIHRLKNGDLSPPLWEAAVTMLFPKHLNPYSSTNIQDVFSPLIEKSTSNGDYGIEFFKFIVSDNKKDAERYLHNLKNKSQGTNTDIKSQIKIASIDAKNKVKSGSSLICLYLSKASDEATDVIAKHVISQTGHPCILFKPSKVTRKKISFKDASNFRVDLFKDMKEKSTITLKDDQVLEITKELVGHTPRFDVYSTFSTKKKLIKERISIEEALKLTRKSIFVGMKRTIHTHPIDGGTLVFDIRNHNKPSIYIEKISTASGKLNNIQGLDLNEEILLKLKPGQHGVKSIKTQQDRLHISVDYSSLKTFEQESTQIVNGIVQKNNITLEPYDLVDSKIPDNRNLDFRIVEEIRELEPYGASFPEPKFYFNCILTTNIRSEEDGTFRVRAKLEDNDIDIPIRFRDNKSIPKGALRGQRIVVVGRLSENYTRPGTLEIIATSTSQ